MKNRNYIYSLMFTVFVCFTGNAMANPSNHDVNRLEALKELLKESPDSVPKNFRDEIKLLTQQQTIENPKQTKIANAVGTINGVVHDTALNPVEGLSIYIYSYIVADNDFENYDSAVTDVNGQYEFTDVDTANTYVIVTRDHPNGTGYINVIWDSTGEVYCRTPWDCGITPNREVHAAPGAISSYDFDVEIGGTISGNIHDASTGIAVDTLAATATDSTTTATSRGITDAAGNYTIKGLPNGSYKVYLSPDNVNTNLHVSQVYGAGECNPSACYSNAYNGMGANINIAGLSDVVGKDFNVRTGARISGRLLDAVTLDTIDSDYGLIYVFDENNRLVDALLINGLSSDAAATGDYSIGGLLPGDYYIQGDGLGMYIREVYNKVHCPWSGCNRSGFGNPVSLLPTQHRIGLNFILDKGGKISGAIQDTTGTNISGESNVQIYDQTGAIVGGGWTTSVDYDGTYETSKAIPPGNYIIKSGNMWGDDYTNAPYVDERYNGTPCPGQSCDLSVANTLVPVAYDAITPNINFTLEMGSSFSGTVTDLDDASPIPDVYVLVYNDNGEFAASATTDDLGNFEVIGLPNGTFYALTNNGSRLPYMGMRPNGSTDFVDILHENIPCPGGVCDVTLGTQIIIGAAKAAPIVNFELKGGATLSGTIINEVSGEAIPSCLVEIYDSTGTFKGAYYSDESGHYQTVGLEPDTYYLRTRNPGFLLDESYGGLYCFPGVCDTLPGDPVTIGQQSEQVVNINFTLKPQYVFSSDF